MYGSAIGGVRISRLLRKRPLPPRGNPVTASRGPAWFSPKPRCELLPPVKKRSGRGTTPGTDVNTFEVPDVAGWATFTLPKGFSTPIRVERANTQWRPLTFLFSAKE